MSGFQMLIFINKFMSQASYKVIKIFLYVWNFSEYNVGEKEGFAYLSGKSHQQLYMNIVVLNTFLQNKGSDF